MEHFHTPWPHPPVDPVSLGREGWHSVWLDRDRTSPARTEDPSKFSTKERSNETCSSQSDAQFRGGGLALRRAEPEPDTAAVGTAVSGSVLSCSSTSPVTDAERVG